jgi:hypothetical protein
MHVYILEESDGELRAKSADYTQKGSLRSGSENARNDNPFHIHCFLLFLSQ